LVTPAPWHAQPLGKRKRDAEGGVAEAKQGKSAATDKKKKGADGEAVGGGSGAGDEHGSIREGDDALKHSIFVQNLPKTATDDAVRALFESCGAIQGVRVVKDKFGSAKGFAYIDFETEEDVRKALEPVEGGRKIEGRLVEVSKSRPLSEIPQTYFLPCTILILCREPWNSLLLPGTVHPQERRLLCRATF